MQSVRPVSDVDAGTYTPTPLWGSLDETTASGDYVSGFNAFTVGMGSLSVPASDLLHRAWAVVRWDQSSGGGGGGIASETASGGGRVIGSTRPGGKSFDGPIYGLTVRVYQGSTQIASGDGIAVSETWGEVELELSEAEGASISDYTVLRVELAWTGLIPLLVDLVAFDAPDPVQSGGTRTYAPSEDEVVYPCEARDKPRDSGPQYHTHSREYVRLPHVPYEKEQADEYPGRYGSGPGPCVRCSVLGIWFSESEAVYLGDGRVVHPSAQFEEVDR